MERKYVDVIEAEAAIKDLFADMPRIEFNGNRRRWREENEQYLRCLDAIRSLPTADVVEKKRYVRCRENVNILADALSEYQSADVVEVVRCKDCKYYNLQHHYCEGIGNWFGLEGEWSDNGFCYKGERRTDDDRNG